ncbi:hypothetical protein BC629DRAFT_1599133 [Irpex lacteus]|nr:hypothetical protein BC629DRAFT_1599133 [Irpex lacteus]
MPEVTLPINEEVVKALDRSTLGLQALAIPRHEGRKPWRHPTNEQEVQLVRRVAQHPCNMLAFEFWGELVQRANSVAADARTPIQWTIARSIGARPLWAPFRAPKSRGSKAKARGRRTARPSEQGGVGQHALASKGAQERPGKLITPRSNLEEQPRGELEDVDGMGPNDGMTIG